MLIITPNLETRSQTDSSFLDDEVKQYLDEMEERYGELPVTIPHTFYETPDQTYALPLTSKVPTQNKHTMKQWIEEFCELNGKPLPPGFEKRDKDALTGMMFGMLRTYGIPSSTLLKNIQRD